MKRAHLFIRFFVRTTQLSAVESAVNAVIDIMLPNCHIFRKQIKPYWKVGDYYEAYLVLSPKEELNLCFHNIMANLAEGWEVHSEPENSAWAVWTTDLKGKFFVPNVVWANLEIVPEGAAVPYDLPSRSEQTPA